MPLRLWWDQLGVFRLDFAGLEGEPPYVGALVAFLTGHRVTDFPHPERRVLLYLQHGLLEPHAPIDQLVNLPPWFRSA